MCMYSVGVSVDVSVVVCEEKLESLSTVTRMGL